MKFTMYRTRVLVGDLLRKVRPYSKAVAAFLAPFVAALVADVLGHDVDQSLVEQAIVAVLVGGTVYAVPNRPKSPEV